MKRLLFLFPIFLTAQQPANLVSPVFSSRITLAATGARPFVCHTSACAAANPGAEVLYDNRVAGCANTFSVAIGGGTATNLSTTFTGLPTTTTHHSGNASYSPDGVWVLLQGMDTATALTCTSPGSDPGGGLGNGLFACKVSTGVCTELTVQGDNTGHFCSAGVPCVVQNALVTYVNDAHGLDRWIFTPDGTKVFGGYIMGNSGGSAFGLRGMLRWCTFTAAPSITACAEVDIPPVGDGSGRFNFYEAAGVLPTVTEASTCTLYATTDSTNGDTNALHVTILRFNICNAQSSFMSQDGCYNEFWDIQNSGTYGIGSSSCLIPNPGSFSKTTGPGPLDAVLGQAFSGAGLIPATSFNSPGNADQPITTFSRASWDWTGGFVVANVATFGSFAPIYRWVFTPPNSATVSGSVNVTGSTVVAH